MSGGTLRPVRDILRDRLTEALEWLADNEDGHPMLIAYGVAQLADHLAAIMTDSCWDPRCAVGEHTHDARYCVLGRQERVVSINGWRGARA